MQESVDAAIHNHTRRHTALRLREDKAMSYTQIGLALGVSRQRAEQMVRAAKSERDNEPA